MTRTRELSRDVVASVMRHALTVLVGLVSLPILARALGATRLGYWALLGASAFVIGLADLGMSSATLREAVGGRYVEAKSLARRATTLTLFVAAPAAVALGAWLLRVTHALPESARPEARIALLLALPFGVLHAAGQPARAYAHGRGRLVQLASARAIAAVSQLLVTIVALRFSLGLIAPALGYAVSVVIELVGGFMAAHDDVTVHHAGAIAPEHRRIAAAALVANIAVVIASRCDGFVLERCTDLATIAGYSLAARLVDQVLTLVKQVSAALVPRLGRQRRDADQILTLGASVVGALAAAPLLALAVAGAPLLAWWAGPAAQHPVVPPTLAALALAAAFAGGEEVVASSLTLGEAAGTVARALSIAAVANVLISVVLSRIIGPVGVALGTTIANGGLFVGLWYVLAQRRGLSRGQVMEMLTPWSLAGLTSGCVAWASCALHAPAILALALASSLGLVAAFVPTFAKQRRAALVVE